MRTANRHIGYNRIEPTFSCKRKRALTRQTKHRILHKNKIMTKKKTRGGVIYLNGSEEELNITVAFNLLDKHKTKSMQEGGNVMNLQQAIKRVEGMVNEQSLDSQKKTQLSEAHAVLLENQHAQTQDSEEYQSSRRSSRRSRCRSSRRSSSNNLGQKLSKLMRHLNGTRGTNIEKNNTTTEMNFKRLGYKDIQSKNKNGADGWCDVQIIAGQLGRSTTADDVIDTVLNDNKQRYQLRHHIINNSQLYQIRCLQGHSRRWGELMANNGLLRYWMNHVWKKIKREKDIPRCVHGTTYESLVLILVSGTLSPMNRTFVHFAIGADNKVVSGMDNRATVLIDIDVKKWMDHGHEVWITPNYVVHLVQKNGRRDVPIHFWSTVQSRESSSGNSFCHKGEYLEKIVIQETNTFMKH